MSKQPLERKEVAEAEEVRRRGDNDSAGEGEVHDVLPSSVPRLRSSPLHSDRNELDFNSVRV